MTRGLRPKPSTLSREAAGQTPKSKGQRPKGKRGMGAGQSPLLSLFLFSAPRQRSVKGTNAYTNIITNTNATTTTNGKRRTPKGQRPKTNGRTQQVNDQKGKAEKQSCEAKAK